jgi:hypothetical protein
MDEGYYGLIQYFPRPETLEAVNVGAYVVCPATFNDVKLSRNHNPIRRRFPGLVFDSVRLHADLQAIANRIRACRGPKELQDLAEQNYGRLMITPPLPMMVEHPSADVAAIFQDLVEELVYTRHRMQAPDLMQALSDLGEEVPIERNVKIPIPVLHRKWFAPVAFLNKARNYVKPHGFAEDERRAIDAASSIGVVGHLLSKSNIRVGEEDVGQRLIVVSNLPEEHDVQKKITEVLGEFGTQVVPVNHIPDLMQHIKENARRMLH